MAITSGSRAKTVSVNGVADLGRFSSSSVPVPDVIAHELGHNLSLYHAPCGGAQGPDPSFPQRDGSIGSWDSISGTTSWCRPAPRTS